MCIPKYIVKSKVLLDGYEDSFKQDNEYKNMYSLYHKYVLASELALNITLAYVSNNKNYKYVAVGIKRVFSQDQKYLKCTMLLILFNSTNFIKLLQNKGFKIIKKEEKL